MMRCRDSVQRVISRIETLDPWPDAVRRLTEAVMNGGLPALRARELMDELDVSGEHVVAAAAAARSGHATFENVSDVFDALGRAGGLRVVAALVFEKLLRDPVSNRDLADAVWGHSLAVAAMATQIAPNAGGDGSLSWLVGVLHEIGRLVAIRVSPEQARAVERDVARGIPLVEADHRHFGVSSNRLAGKAAFVLGLPPALCALLTALEDPGLTPVPEVAAVAAADALAPILGHPPLPGALAVPLDEEYESSFKLDPETVAGLAEEASRAVRMVSGEAPGAIPLVEPASSFDALLEANRRLARLNADYERTRRELEDRVRETKSLVSTFASLTMGLDEDALRYSILESLLEHYEAHSTFLVTSDERGGKLRGVAFSMRGAGEPEVLPVRVDLSRFDRETRQTLLEGTAVTVRGGATARLLREELDDSPLFCLAPIMARGIWSGILGLAVGEGQERAAGKGEFLNILATATALGMENARLYGEVLQQATMDPLTGIATRRVVVEELDELASAAAAERPPFAVLLVDLDNFKAVNDTLGHQAGDQYLEEMSAAMARPLRDQDSIGRYGGDEFLILLRDVSLEEAQMIAERIRYATEATSRGPRWIEVMDPLGASIGISWWDGGPVESAALLAMADSSLYIGKSEGRNAVGVAAVRERV